MNDTYKIPKPTSEDINRVRRYWRILINTQKSLLEYQSVLSYSEIEGYKRKIKKYKECIAVWNSIFRIKTDENY